MDAIEIKLRAELVDIRARLELADACDAAHTPRIRHHLANSVVFISVGQGATTRKDGNIMGAINRVNRKYMSIDAGVVAYGFGAKDQQTVRDTLALAGALHAYDVESGRYVGYTNESGDTVVYQARTYLAVTPRAACQPAGEVMSGKLEEGAVRVPLSGWQGERSVQGANAPTALRVGELCLSCFEHRSLAGTCRCSE